MAQYSVKIKNLRELQAKLKDYPEISEKHLQKAVSKGAAEFHKNATRANVPWKTGNLVQSFGVVLGRLYASVAPNRSTPAKYAVFVHEGTGPHTITAKNGKALFWTGAKHPVKSVKHPGTRPNKFIPRILERSEARIQMHFKDALDRIAKEIANI